MVNLLGLIDGARRGAAYSLEVSGFVRHAGDAFGVAGMPLIPVNQAGPIVVVHLDLQVLARRDYLPRREGYPLGGIAQVIGHNEVGQVYDRIGGIV